MRISRALPGALVAAVTSIAALAACGDIDDSAAGPSTTLGTEDAGSATAEYATRVWPILRDNCVSCHAGAGGSGGFSIAELESEQYARQNPNKLSRIVRRLDIGEMPPPPRELALESRRIVVDWAEGVLFPENCGETADPGAPRARRLTKRELRNTLRDTLLLGDYLPGESLPEDVVNGGFTNEEGALQIRTDQLAPTIDAVLEAVDKAFAEGSASRQALLPCAATNVACVDSALLAFARRAFRRPLTEADTTWVKARRVDASAASSLRNAFAAVLLAPQVQLKLELDPAPDDSVTVHPVSAHELASRLAYFLTEAPPDVVLAASADDGSILRDDVLVAHARRLVASPKCTLVTGMGHEWLGVESLSAPEGAAEKALQQSMINETDALLDDVLRGKQAPLTDLLASPVAHVDARLARHYGLANISGEGIQKVPVTGTSRTSGVLTQGTWLKATSSSDSTSPTQRGKSVLDTFYCQPPPSPPETVDTDSLEEAKGPKRQAMETHRKDPGCASCHATMDPIGFAFEPFGPWGEHRDKDEHGNAVEPAGSLPTTGPFASYQDLTRVLAADPKFPRCVAEKVVTYARGRRVTDADRCISRDVSRRAGGKTFQDLVIAFVQSRGFKARRGGRTGTPEVSK